MSGYPQPSSSSPCRILAMRDALLTHSLQHRLLHFFHSAVKPVKVPILSIDKMQSHHESFTATLLTRCEMVATVDSTSDMTTESSQTGSSYTAEVTTVEERNPVDVGSLLPFQTPVVVIGVLGIIANGFVLSSFWFADRSKMTTARKYIANQTTLESHQSPFS